MPDPSSKNSEDTAESRKPDTSVTSRMLTLSERQQLQRDSNAAFDYLQKVYPNLKTV